MTQFDSTNSPFVSGGVTGKLEVIGSSVGLVPTNASSDRCVLAKTYHLKTLLSFHLKEFFSFVFFRFLFFLHRRPRLVRNLSVGFSPT